MDPTLSRNLRDRGVSDDFISLLEKNAVVTFQDLADVVDEDCLPPGTSMDFARVKKLVRARASGHISAPSRNIVEINNNENEAQSPPFRKPRNEQTPVQIPITVPTPTPTTTKKPISTTLQVKSAGVLPLRYTGTFHECLLACEHREGSLCLNFFGGGLNSLESPKDGAVREFLEECSLDRNHALSTYLQSAEMKRTHLPHGKYEMFVLDISTVRNDYAKLFSSLNSAFTPNSEVKGVHWVTLDDLLTASGSVGYPFSSFIVNSRPILHTFLSKLLLDLPVNDLKEDKILPKHFQQLLTEQRTELGKSLKKKSLLDWFPNFKEWRLKKFDLFLPKDEDLSPFTVVTKNDAPFAPLLQQLSLPQQTSQLISTIRKVNVPARKSAFDQLCSKSNQSSIIKVFHGTPESWRATAIALNGFDLKIKLVGRAFGDGVYCTTDSNQALSYSKSRGSLLRCDAMLEANSKNVTPQSRPPVYVFPQPHHVLPVLLLDFTPDNSALSKKTLTAKPKQDKIIEAKRKQMAKEEKVVEKELEKRYGSMVKNFKSRIDHLANLFSRTPDESAKLYKLLKQESRYFESKLPIYYHRSQIVDALHNNNLLIVECDTGSGKSTMICQYVHDYYQELSIGKGDSDKRKIAILQPRRDNAIQLASTVAQSRHGVCGDEVGYSIGLGSQCTTDNTKIEYLTHGKFQQMSVNADNVLRNFKCVIVDEAHFRSIQIDFVLSLLKLVIDKARNQNISDFKVIITTATFDKQFLNLLNNFYSSVAQVEILKFNIPSYPVLVHNIDVFGDNYDQALAHLSFDYFSNAIINGAIDMTVKLLQSTTDGAILVFLPSKSSIDKALSVFKSKFMSHHQGSNSLTFTDNHFSFLVDTKSKAQPQVRVGIYAFHGTLTKAERTRALEAAEDRCVYFSTDLAETGLTIRDVRYVIDSGFTQNVRWNSKSNMEEMTRELVSKSSAIQRKGRAGRTKSGICIRLYPESVFEKMKDGHEPAIKTGHVLKSVLSFLHLQSTVADFELIDPFHAQVYQNSVDLLQK
ncbi:hypothetical protein GEMRC1_003584 [Eukaryota sp. GEM-RC1]